MKCPSCKKTAISFFEWGKSLNWHRTKCRSCGRGLKAAPLTWVMLIGSVVLAVAAVFVSAHILKIEPPMSALPAFVVIFLMGVISYCIGNGYVIAEDKSKPRKGSGREGR